MEQTQNKVNQYYLLKQNKNILPHAESKPFLPITLYWFMLRQAII